jgi:hypothetical protein
VIQTRKRSCWSVSYVIAFQIKRLDVRNDGADQLPASYEFWRWTSSTPMGVQFKISDFGI